MYSVFQKHIFFLYLSKIYSFMVRLHCPTPTPIPILIQIPVICRKVTLGPILIVILMQSYYENYLKTTLLIPISVSNWVQYPSASE